MTPGLPFPSDEERLVSSSENGVDPEDEGVLGDGFAVYTVGKRPKKSRVIGGTSSHRDRFEGPRATADFVRDTGEHSRRLADVSQSGDVEAGGSSAAQIDALEARVSRLSSVCEAMWQLVSAEVGLELGQLAAKLQQMDGSDAGFEDRDADQTTCPNCGNRKPADQKLCLFCSARAPIEDARP